jgi:hypothetical protein
MKPRLSIPVFTLLILTAASIATLIFYGADLPPTLAVHFGQGGRADGFQDRIMFIVMRSFWTMTLPPAVAVLGLLPRIFNWRLNVPNKAFWDGSPERRAAAYDRILWLALWTAAGVQAFLFATQSLLMRGNLVQPASLPGFGLVVMIAVPVLGVAAIAIMSLRAFEIPRG